MPAPHESRNPQYQAQTQTQQVHSQNLQNPQPSRFRLTPLTPRDPEEPGRVASSLELFFDLVFVIAISISASELHHQLSAGHVLAGLSAFAHVFFGIWWAWMNYTWLGTSFSQDDWLYRLVTFVQMSGVLVLAAGIKPVYEDGNYTLVVIGYIIMRIALVTQWLRAARGTRDPSLKRTAHRYALGVTIVQLLWWGALALPGEVFAWVFFVLVGAELLVPAIAERQTRTPVHPHHITERYSLFTLILLGESLLGSANAIIEALHEKHNLAPLIALGVLTLVVTAGLWWVYFWPPHHSQIGDLKSSLIYGYGHYFVFAAVGAFSAGIEAEVDLITGTSSLSQPWASFAYTAPIAVFLLGVWLLVVRALGDAVVNTVMPLVAVLVLIDPLIPVPFALTTVLIAVLVAVLVWREPRLPQPLPTS